LADLIRGRAQRLAVRKDFVLQPLAEFAKPRKQCKIEMLESKYHRQIDAAMFIRYTFHHIARSITTGVLPELFFPAQWLEGGMQGE